MFYNFCFFFMTMVLQMLLGFFLGINIFFVAFSRANFAVEIEMTTVFSVSPFQVFISH